MALKFFLVCISKLLLPALFVYFSTFWLHLPPLIRALLYLLSTPLYFYARGFWYARKRKLHISAWGAQEMPLWAGYLPGHIDLLVTFHNHWKNGYPGDGLDDAVDTLGTTFRSNFCGRHQVRSLSAPLLAC
jgi:hypothetical protein